MSTVLSIIAAFILLSVFVFVHELGHYGAGRLLGFKILEFSIGMGPKLLKKEKNGILYSIRAFPIGGMCRFYGEDEQVSDGMGFNAHKVWKRIIVVAAGPVMNILFAFLLAIAALGIYGDYFYLPAVVELPIENSPAKEAGIEVGDIILSIDGKAISYETDLGEIISEADGKSALVKVLRGEEELTLTVNDMYDEAKGSNFMGISYNPYAVAQRVRFNFFEAIAHSFDYVISIIGEMFNFLGSIFTEGVKEGDVGGPVAVITILGQAVRLGFETVLRMGVLMSVNLGIMNILPFPALDGGRLVFLTIEGVRRKPISAEKEGMVHFVGLIILFALIIFLSIKDVMGLFGG
ncbi:MAG: site-2 protease family protein [Clostridia bacterium]|nr:site-2 protease family protein [Clostridia bacterium]